MALAGDELVNSGVVEQLCYLNETSSRAISVRILRWALRDTLICGYEYGLTGTLQHHCTITDDHRLLIYNALLACTLNIESH